MEETIKTFTIEEIEAWNDDRKRGRLFNCLSGVKSAILVGTRNSEKQTNLAIFSSLFHLGANPALMGMVVRPDISPRHTLENIKSMEFFTLNLIPYEFHSKAHQTSARYPEDLSEFKAVGLSEEWHPEAGVPFVKESKVKWLMKLVRIIDIPENQTHIIIGEVKEIRFPQDILSEDGALAISETDPTLVTGLDCYHQVTKGVRYTYAKADKEPQRL